MIRCSFILLLLIAVWNTQAQDWARINELTYDAEYYFMTKQYDKAIKSYSDILKQIPDNANIKYKLGVCYLNTDNEKDKAIQYFNEASSNISPDYNPNSDKEEGAPLETYFLLGSAYRVTNQLDKAVNAYRDYMVNLNPKETKQRQIAEHYLEACQTAKEMMANPRSVTITNLGNLINDESSNFNAVISGDGNTLVYTTSKKYIYNIMMSAKANGTWTKPKAITRQITSKNNFKTSAISADGTTLYLVEEDPFNSEIYTSTLTKGRWSSAQKLKKPINSKMNETHASPSPDGKTLYFTSNRTGGEGDLDIYYCTQDEKGKWGKPVNMGPKINTLYNEETPFISPDGNRLYFSSEGHTGMGGYDIFYINLHEVGSEPVNLGYPINTTDNDLFFVPGSNKYEGYYARMDPSGYGSKDIDFIEIHPAVELTGTILPDNNPLSIDTNLFMVSLIDLSNYSTLSPTKPRTEQGGFSYKIIPGKYLLSVNAPDYKSFSKEIEIDQDPQELKMTVNAPLTYEPPVVAETEMPENQAEEVPPTTENVPEIKEEPVQPEITEPPAKTEEPIITEQPVTEMVTTPQIVEKPVAIETELKPISKPVTVSPSRPAITYTGQSFIDEVVNELNDVSAIPSGTPVTYTVQLFALSKPVDLSYFRNLEGISVHLDADNLYKYTWGIVNTLDEAENLKNQAKAIGYRDVIIRRRAIIPEYTIQVMAGKAPVDFGYFRKFDRLKVTLGRDGYNRYFIGEYADLNEARDELNRLKEMGYPKAFIKKL